MMRHPTLATRHWAVLYALVAAVSVVVLLLAMPRTGEPEAPSECRKQTEGHKHELACLGGVAPSILTAELAGTPAIWACQVQRGMPLLALDEPHARCAELRAEDLRAQIAQFDNGLFIPLYAGLTLLVLGWLTSTANVSAAGRGVHALALALALVTALLVAMDRMENRRALSVIDRVQAYGVAAALADSPSIDEPAFVKAAVAARRASLQKWAASALWAGVLAAALVLCLRETVDRLEERPRWSRWARPVAALPPLALTAAALMFAAGAAVGLAGSTIALPTALLGAGMGAAMGGMVGAALMVALVR